MKNIVGKNKLVTFDALSHYKKYSDLFDIDDVPEEERKKVAQGVADWILSALEKNMQHIPKPA